MTLIINDKTSIDTLNYIHLNYENYFETENKIKSQVEENLNQHLQYNNIKLIGEIPYFTLYNLSKIKKRILEIDEDGIIGIVGEPGLGKSTLSIIFSLYLEKDFNSKKIIFDFTELLQFFKICADEIQKEKTLQNYTSNLRASALILDEGVYMLFSADTMTKQGKLATKLFTVIRFLNIVMFINMTNFEKLDKTIRETRLYSLIKINKKANISFFSKKRVRQIECDNNLKFPTPNFSETVGYISKDNLFWENYIKRKSQFVSNSISQILQEVNKK